MPLPRSMLDAIPAEVLQHIALEVVLDDLPGPPTALYPLISTCRALYHKLAPDHAPNLYARIFKCKFDLGAVTRRSFTPRSSQLVEQLRVYCKVLRVIQEGDIYHPDVDDILFTALMMMMDNDGKNGMQLEWAGIDTFVDRFVRLRVYESRESHNGWPAESTENTCALWLMWMTTTEEKLLAESETQRQQIINIVLPYVLVPYRYSSAQAPPNHFNLPLPEDSDSSFPHSFITAHSAYPIYREPNRAWNQIHFTSRAPFSPPLITIAAKLIYFSRREIIPFGIPPHLPLTRAHANQLGITDIGPTQEDVVEFNAHKDSKLLEPTRWEWWDGLNPDELHLEDRGLWDPRLKAPSAKWDNDWWRARYCYNATMEPDQRNGHVYTPGMLTGLWQGRMLIPSETQFNALVTTPQFPTDFSEGSFSVTTVPLYMRLREHHCISPRVPVPCGGTDNDFDDGLRNAYLPAGTRFETIPGGVRIHANGQRHLYETHNPAHTSHTPDTCLMCEERAREADDRAKERREFEEYEHHFAGVGLGLRSGNVGGGARDERDSVMEMDVGEDVEYGDECLDEPTKAPACDGIRDIVLEGETDLRHGLAWNHFVYQGRVRPWDGLIGILRISRDRRLGDIFFYGYIVGGQNFVGNWRIAFADVAAPVWESAFTMSKRDD